jgi:hypothetical protein
MKWQAGFSCSRRAGAGPQPFIQGRAASDTGLFVVSSKPVLMRLFCFQRAGGDSPPARFQLLPAPIAGIVVPSVIPRSRPIAACIGRTGPITGAPRITRPAWVPIPAHPRIPRADVRRPVIIGGRRRRWWPVNRDRTRPVSANPNPYEHPWAGPKGAPSQ